MRYVVLGAGLQGPAVAYALARKIPDSQGRVFICEVDKARADRTNWLFGKLRHHFEDSQGPTLIKIEEGDPPLDLFRLDTDLTVISTLPYNLNLGIAEQCVQKGWRYYDLGGHIQTSEAIAKLAMEKNPAVPLMTDLGLAPGLVNILGEYPIRDRDAGVHQPHSLLMRCGGLPLNPDINNLGYKVVFSSKGLVNEYFNDCEALIDGKVVPVAPMGNANMFDWRGIMCESFNTSGGAHTTLDIARQHGLKNASYQTIRYLGHMRTVKFLKYDVGMTDEQLAKLFDEKVGMTTEDKVIISVRCGGPNGVWVWEDEILHDEYFTAMQRATGFSAAAIVLATKDIYDKPLLTYADSPAPAVFEQLDGLLEIKL